MRRPRRTVAAASLAVAVLVAAIGAGVVGFAPAPTTGDDPPAKPGIERLHSTGIIGENVTVGVVDPTGFDRENPRIDGRVDAARTFGEGGGPLSEARSHGTASAAVVARTAPDARLVLATVGSYADYRAAVRWLLARDVDVVLAPASFLGRERSPADSVATRATRNGTVFVAATGNLATGHWAGAFDPVGDDGRVSHRFGTAAGDDEGNATRLRVHGDAREFSLWLSWADGGPFTATLYRTQNGRTERVARSERYPGDGVPNARLVADLGPGSYFVVVRGPADDAGAGFELETATGTFPRATPRGSVAPPATAPGVLAVGAFDPRTGAVEPFSGRGPTVDGRLGVDVVAADRRRVAGRSFVGTSASAAGVAGVVALLLDADPSLSPRAVEVALERTAVPVGPPGPDPVSGYGRVSPWEAVNATRNGTVAEGKAGV